MLPREVLISKNLKIIILSTAKEASENTNNDLKEIARQLEALKLFHLSAAERCQEILDGMPLKVTKMDAEKSEVKFISTK